MTLNVIKLNPSQELALVRARDGDCKQDKNEGGADAKLAQDQKAAARLVRIPIEPEKPIPLSPLLCVLPDDFTKEEFLTITRFEINGLQNLNAGGESGECSQDQNGGGDKKDAPICFCARIQTKERELKCPIPAAIDFSQAKNFSLEKTFSLAKDFFQDQERRDEKSRSAESVLLAPTSFYFARAEISKNTWSLYDAVWKKISGKNRSN